MVAVYEIIVITTRVQESGTSEVAAGAASSESDSINVIEVWKQSWSKRARMSGALAHF